MKKNATLSNTYIIQITALLGDIQTLLKTGSLDNAIREFSLA